MAGEKEYNFLDSVSGQSLITTTPKIKTRNVTYDGEIYQMVSVHTYGWHKFYYSTDKVEHNRQQMDYFLVLSELGGL